jgi:small subunit ribosomal protein S6
LKIFLLQEEPQWFERGLGPKKMAYEIQNKKSGFYHLFEFNVPGEVLIAFETEFRRDERVMRFLTVSLDKHAISWLKEEEQN